MGDELDSHFAGRAARHDYVRNKHDFGLQLLREQSGGTETRRGTTQRKSVADPRGVCNAAGGDDDRAERLQPARRRPEQLRWARIPPFGLLAVQGFPTQREVPFGVPFGIFQYYEPSELLESRMRRKRRDRGPRSSGLYEQQFRHDYVDARRAERPARNTICT